MAAEIFTVYSDYINNRLDPYYYEPNFIETLNKIHKSTYEIVNITDVCSKITDGTHFTPKYLSEGIPFLSVKNVRENLILFDDIKYISVDEHKILSKRCHPVKGDILLTKVGTIGLATVIPEGLPEFSIFVSVALLKTKKNILPSFLAILLNTKIIRIQFYRELKGIGVPDLHLESIGSINIPLPPLYIQEQIVQIMGNAYRLKKENEQKAEELLNSIDDYVLEQLDIKLTKYDDKKVFTVYSDEVQNSRIDPYYHQPKYVQLNNEILNSKYEVNKLSDIILNLTNGKEFRKYSENGFRYLRVSDLDKHGSNDKNIRYIDIKEIPGSIKLTQADFLISRSGSLGLVSVVNEKLIDSVLSSHIFKLRLNLNLINPYYLEAYLRSTIGQLQFVYKNNGGIIPEINQSALRSIMIVTPPLNIQESISLEVQNRIKQAEELKLIAEKSVEQAKAKVEKILFGE